MSAWFRARTSKHLGLSPKHAKCTGENPLPAGSQTEAPCSIRTVKHSQNPLIVQIQAGVKPHNGSPKSIFTPGRFNADLMLLGFPEIHAWKSGIVAQYILCNDHCSRWHVLLQYPTAPQMQMNHGVVLRFLQEPHTLQSKRDNQAPQEESATASKSSSIYLRFSYCLFQVSDRASALVS